MRLYRQNDEHVLESGLHTFRAKSAIQVLLAAAEWFDANPGVIECGYYDLEGRWWQSITFDAKDYLYTAGVEL